MSYEPGDRVVYYQPGVDEILASWQGRTAPRSDGEEKTAEITRVSRTGHQTYYETDEGVMLTDCDIRRRAS